MGSKVHKAQARRLGVPTAPSSPCLPRAHILFWSTLVMVTWFLTLIVCRDRDLSKVSGRDVGSTRMTSFLLSRSVETFRSCGMVRQGSQNTYADVADVLAIDDNWNSRILVP